jgi:hypothetical protein
VDPGFHGRISHSSYEEEKRENEGLLIVPYQIALFSFET